MEAGIATVVGGRNEVKYIDLNEKKTTLVEIVLLTTLIKADRDSVVDLTVVVHSSAKQFLR